MTADSQLASVYQRFKDNEAIRRACGNAECAESMMREITAPFLIKTNEEYQSSNPKIVVVGQETRGWYHKYPTLGDFYEKGTVKEATNHYEDMLCSYNKGPFIHRLHEIREEIFGAEFGSVKRKRVLWLNLFKFAHGSMNKSRFKESVLKLQDRVFQQEISLLNPNVVIFLTGPSYDCIIERFFDGIQYESISEFRRGQAAKLHHDLLPPLSFRTYHPNYRNRSIEKVDGCLRAILAIVKNAYEGIRIMPA